MRSCLLRMARRRGVPIGGIVRQRDDVRRYTRIVGLLKVSAMAVRAYLGRHLHGSAGRGGSMSVVAQRFLNDHRFVWQSQGTSNVVRSIGVRDISPIDEVCLEIRM